MKLEKTFLHSKLGRRIFWLFVLCALIPITVLALISLRNETAQISEQSHSQMHQASREEAITVYERLSSIEADLKLIAFATRGQSTIDIASMAGGSNGLLSDLSSRLKGLELITRSGNHRSLLGQIRAQMKFTDQEQELLRSGKSVLSTEHCDRAQPCIFLSRELGAGHTDEGILVAEVNSSYLWDIENLPQDMDTYVLDQAGNILFCSAECPESFPPQATQSFSGEFEWKVNGREIIANYWDVPLGSSFSAPHWTIVSGRPKPDVLAPLVRFKGGFILTYLLALWIVLLLSLVLIRRNLIPLGKLKEGTGQLSLGHFQTRVTVKSGDEFQELAASFNFMADRIEKQLNSLRVVNEVDRAILSAWDIEKIVDTISNRLSELIPLDLVSVNLIDPSGLPSARTYIYGPALNFKRVEEFVEVTSDEVREFNRQPQVSILGESKHLPNYIGLLHSRGMRYFLVTPILVEGNLSAIMTLGYATACIWTEEDKERARKLGDQLAVALANSRLVNQLQQLQWGSLTALARAIDAKSSWTMGHSERVTKFAVKIAAAMGLPSKELDIIRRGGLLHDIGKIGIPVSILDKPGRLTPEETKTMNEHVNIGAKILEPIPGLAESMPIVKEHHEWINGEGYPRGLRGEEISLHARIFAVADCFDALVSDRPYRAGMSVERATQIIQEGVGKQFDPTVFEVFRRIAGRQMFGEEREEAPTTVAEVR